MQYRHVKTGAVIDVQSQMGGCWIPVTGNDKPPVGNLNEPKPEPTQKKAPVKKTQKKKPTNEEW